MNLLGCGRLSQTENLCMAEAVGEVRTSVQAMMSCRIGIKALI